MYRITKEFAFEASHHLVGLPDGHKCGRDHGHSYRVEMILESDTLTGPGFVRDYGELAPVRAWIDATWDHHNLNDVHARLGPEAAPWNPTAEFLALHLFAKFQPTFPELVAVRVSETAHTWAEYRQ